MKSVRHGGGASGESAGVGGVVVSQHSGGTISSLSGSEGGARSPVDATDGDATGALAMLNDSPLPAVPVAAATGVFAGRAEIWALKSGGRRQGRHPSALMTPLYSSSRFFYL